MADRSSIRTLYSFTEALYDMILLSGLSYAAYLSYLNTDYLTANEGEVLVVDRRLLPSRIVRSTSYFLLKPRAVFSVPHYSNEQIRVAMANEHDDLLEFSTRLRLHAKDPLDARVKHGSGLRGRYIKTIEEFLRKEGQHMRLYEASSEEVRARLEDRIQRYMYEDERDPNILHEVYIEAIRETPVPKRVLPELL